MTDKNSKVKLLIAEDDKFLGQAYRLKLEKSGFEIKIVENGMELLSMIKVFTPKVIILDLVMPEMDGFEVLNILKHDTQYKDIVVIIASNLGQKEDIDKALKLGAADYFIKSDLSMKDLVTTVNKYI